MEYLYSPRHEGLVIGVSVAYLILLVVIVIIEDYLNKINDNGSFDTTMLSVV